MAAYNDYAVAFPEEWTDRSTVRWIAPVRFEETPTLKKQQLPRENFVIERQPLKSNTPALAEYLQERLETLQNHLDTFVVVEPVSEWENGDVKGVVCSYTFVMEQLPVRQLHAVVFSESTAYHLIGTATKSGYAEAESVFQSILQSFSLHEG